MQQDSILHFFLILAAISTIVFVFVFFSSWQDDTNNEGVKNALRKRFWFILILLVSLGIFASVTIPKSPYFLFADEVPSKIIHVAAMQYAFLLSEKNIDAKNPVGESIILPSNRLVEFRVTSLDVNHGFAIYNSEMQLITQTQAMPGYVNSLRYKFDKPGKYQVLCLELCGVGHPVMQSTFKVQ